MKRTYVVIDGVLVEKTAQRSHDTSMIQGDIAPYRSMIDGSLIEGRAQHRAHLKQHGCIEVGNETMQTVKPKPDGEERRARLVAQLDSMSHNEANRVLRELREHVRFHHPHREH